MINFIMLVHNLEMAELLGCKELTLPIYTMSHNVSFWYHTQKCLMLLSSQIFIIFINNC